MSGTYGSRFAKCCDYVHVDLLPEGHPQNRFTYLSSLPENNSSIVFLAMSRRSMCTLASAVRCRHPVGQSDSSQRSLPGRNQRSIAADAARATLQKKKFPIKFRLCPQKQSAYLSDILIGPCDLIEIIRSVGACPRVQLGWPTEQSIAIASDRSIATESDQLVASDKYIVEMVKLSPKVEGERYGRYDELTIGLGA